jgi:hypothetical protein
MDAATTPERMTAMLEIIKETFGDVRYWIEDHKPEVLLVSVMGPLLVLIAVLLFQPTEAIAVNGYLVGKEYTPASSSVGVGSGVSSDGKPVTVVTTNHKSEKWSVVLEVNGEYLTLEVSPKTYYALPDASNVSLVCYRGKWLAYIKACE